MSQNIQASFTVEIKELNSTLMAISRLTGRFTKSSVIQIRVFNATIEISSKGITKRINLTTNGEADISLPVILLKGYLTGSTDPYKTFIFRNGELGCGSSIFSSHTIKVEPVFTTTENVLHNNLSKKSILKYWINKTEKENERIGLTATIEVVKHQMKTNIQEALFLLGKYNVVYEDLKELIKRKLNDLA